MRFKCGYKRPSSKYRDARRRAGYLFSEFSEKVGIEAKRLSEIERNRVKPICAEVEKLDFELSDFY